MIIIYKKKNGFINEQVNGYTTEHKHHIFKCYNRTSCVADYITARSMKEGKGSNAKKAKEPTKNPKEAHD